MKIAFLIGVAITSIFSVWIQYQDADRDNTIQAVTTWQQLLEQPTIKTSEFSVRLGLDALSAPVNSGILIYCLTDHAAMPKEFTGPRPLGPFIVEIKHEFKMKKNTIEQIASFQLQEQQGNKQSRLLFRKSIPFDRPGKYQIRILSPSGEEVASAEVTATENLFHCWMPFARDTNLQPESEQLDSDSFDAYGFLKNRPNGIAIPNFDGMVPVVLGENDFRQRLEEKLPTLFPESDKQELKLTSIGSDLVIESKQSIILARPDWHFLARWWINGKPYQPKQMRALGDQNGVVFVGKKMLLRLKFDPEPWQVKTGDKVEVQLLYCKNGWTLVQPFFEMLAVHVGFEGPELLLSNRIQIEWEPTDE